MGGREKRRRELLRAVPATAVGLVGLTGVGRADRNRNDTIGSRSRLDEVGVDATVSTPPSFARVGQFSPADPGDSFGNVVGVSGSVAVVGAPNDADPNGRTEDGYGAGSAFVYETSADGWVRTAKLAPDDGDPGDLFGLSVAVSGETIFVGAPSDVRPDDRQTGSVYVFERSDGNWTQRNKLLPDDASDGANFGASVALEGETAVVGSPFEEDSYGDFSGAVYAFEREGGRWNQRRKILPGDDGSGGRFGNSVALAGDTALVGELNYAGLGSAHVLERTDGQWTYQESLRPGNSSESDRFGYSVSVSDDTALVSARKEPGPEGEESGATYVFGRGTDGWTREAKLTPTFSGGWFGTAMDIEGDTALVGTALTGQLYVFRRSDDGWRKRNRIIGDETEPPAEFGGSVALSEGTAFVGGANQVESSDKRKGIAFVYEENLAPTASAGSDLTVEEGTEVTLDATGSTDPDDDSLNYEWTQVSGPSVSVEDAATTTFTAPEVDEETLLYFEVAVDDGSVTETDRMTVTVTDSNASPSADAGPDRTVRAGTTVTLDATGSTDPDGDSLSYAWTQSKGPSVTLSGSDTAEPSFEAPELGTETDFVFQVVVDDGTRSATDTTTVTVSPVETTGEPTERSSTTASAGNTTESDGQGMPGFGIATALTALGGGALWGRMRGEGERE